MRIALSHHELLQKEIMSNFATYNRLAFMQVVVDEKRYRSTNSCLMAMPLHVISTAEATEGEICS